MAVSCAVGSGKQVIVMGTVLSEGVTEGDAVSHFFAGTGVVLVLVSSGSSAFVPVCDIRIHILNSV